MNDVSVLSLNSSLLIFTQHMQLFFVGFVGVFFCVFFVFVFFLVRFVLFNTHELKHYYWVNNLNVLLVLG